MARAVMKWLKYQHKFSSGRSAWQWQLVDDGETLREALKSLAANLRKLADAVEEATS